MGVTFALFQSTGTSSFAMLPGKNPLSGDAMAGATSRSIVELKLYTPGALYGFNCNSFFNTTFWRDSSVVLVKIFTGSGKLSVTSSMNAESKYSFNTFAVSTESVHRLCGHLPFIMNKGTNSVFCPSFKSSVCRE